MTGEEENLKRMLPEISNEDRLRLERHDFDIARQEIYESLSPVLSEAITDRFGIKRVVITGDDSGEWAFDRDYSETISWKAERQDDDGSEKLFVISPGYGAIDRYSEAIELYSASQPNGEIKFISKTTAFEMYAAGLTVNVFFDAALTEVEGRTYPDAIPKMNLILDELGDSTKVTDAIQRSDFADRTQLLQLLNFAFGNWRNTLRANRIRFAAGLYFENHRSSEQPLQEAVVGAMRLQLSKELAFNRSQDEAMFLKFGFHTPTLRDVSLAQELTTDDSIIGQLEAFNRAKADRIQLDLVGWAFPMDRVELKKTIHNFGKMT